MSSYNVIKRKELINDLVQMAYADTDLGLEEKEFILAVATRMRIPKKEVLELLKNRNTKGTSIPNTISKRIVHFHRIMLVMFIDGNINDKELQLLREIALRYGYSHEVVTELIEAMKRHPYGEIPANELMQIHQRGYN